MRWVCIAVGCRGALGDDRDRRDSLTRGPSGEGAGTWKPRTDAVSRLQSPKSAVSAVLVEMHQTGMRGVAHGVTWRERLWLDGTNGTGPPGIE
jgi:hypothetical protein